MNKLPQISFGIIVLNGEPFTLYNLRSIYPFAHEIMVVEGASKNAAEHAPDGHSIDGTLEVLHRFKKEEDKENKMQIITKDGFWEEKDQQSQAYAQKATGDYLWQIDIDEFYREEDMSRVCKLLIQDPLIDGIGFKWKNFWGDFDVLVDSWVVRQREREWGGFPRIFRWQNGFRYTSHRPPTVIDSEGKELRKGRWVSGACMARKDIFCYHYGMVFDKQAKQKMSYYKNMWPNHKDMEKWYGDEFLNLKRPFKVLHGTKRCSWLKRFSDKHPEQIIFLMRDAEKMGYIKGNKKAIEKCLNSKFYNIASCSLSILEAFVWFLYKVLYHILVVTKIIFSKQIKKR